MDKKHYKPGDKAKIRLQDVDPKPIWALRCHVCVICEKPYNLLWFGHKVCSDCCRELVKDHERRYKGRPLNLAESSEAIERERERYPRGRF